MEIAGIDRVVGLVEVDKLLGLGGFEMFGLVGVLCICGKKCNFVGYLRWYYS